MLYRQRLFFLRPFDRIGDDCQSDGRRDCRSATRRGSLRPRAVTSFPSPESLRERLSPRTSPGAAGRSDRLWSDPTLSRSRESFIMNHFSLCQFLASTAGAGMPGAVPSAPFSKFLRQEVPTS
tara:strand:- start:8033 stop:8401 length:369 start_codon:yes stop_codon:yes gene_type:complete